MITRINGELCHFGIPGMKWGVRRSRPKSSGFRRKKVATGSEQPKRKTVKTMTDEELMERTRRINLENEYKAAKARSKSQSTHKQSTSQEAPKKKSVSEMSNDELQEAINRKMLEQRYRELNPQQVSVGQKFVKAVGKNVVKPVAEDVAKQMLKSLVVSTINDKLELDEDKKLYTNNKKK